MKVKEIKELLENAKSDVRILTYEIKELKQKHKNDIITINILYNVIYLSIISYLVIYVF